MKVQLEAPVKEVFKNTALDPEAEVRHELMRKARRIRKGKKKKKKSSRSRSKGSSKDESGESSDSSSLGEKQIATSELFESERRSLRFWRRVPGALTQAAILDMQDQMMTAHGYVNQPVTGEQWLPWLFSTPGRTYNHIWELRSPGSRCTLRPSWT